MLNLELISFTYLVAEEDMRCDAFGVWEDLSPYFTADQKAKGVCTWFNARHGIKKGETFLKYEFSEIDQWTGEVMHEYYFNCKIDMNKVMIKNGLYPNSMKLAFAKSKEDHKHE